MIYDIISLKMKLEAAAADWNRSETAENALAVLEVLDEMERRNDTLYIDRALYGETSGTGETWIAAYTSSFEEEIRREEISVRSLFEYLTGPSGKEIRGIVINPKTPFYLQKEIVRMSWKPENASYGEVAVRVSAKTGEDAVSVEWVRIGPKEYPLIRYDREKRLYQADIPERLSDEKHDQAFRNAVWNLMDACLERKTEKLAVSSVFYPSEKENRYALRLFVTAVKVWEKILESYRLDLVICTEPEKEKQLAEQVSQLLKEFEGASGKN